MSRLKEQRAWDALKKHADNSGVRFWRVENLMVSGMPDLVGVNRNGATFWIEMKALDCWPARESTRPLRTSFEPGQIPFMKEWITYGGTAFVLLRVNAYQNEFDWLLLDPKGGKDLVDMTRDELTRSSVCIDIGPRGIIKYLEGLER
jgi:penicillin-binding protein-related factor A (putative recombinase)